MANQTWEVRERAILEAIYGAEEEELDTIGWATVVDRTGLDERLAIRTIRSLHEGEYITGIKASTFDGYELLNIRLLPKGRRAIGQWPSEDPYQSLMSLLEAQITLESDPRRRSKLEGLRTALRDVGVDVAGSVLGAFARQAAGL